jgi:DNA-binding MarR family transcriptional regulator
MESTNVEKIFQAIHRLKKISFTEDMLGSLSHSEFAMMNLIKHNAEEGKGVKISTIGNLLKISNPAVSQMINVLEDKGYVERITTKNDRRVVYVQLTKTGEGNLEEALQCGYKAANEILGRMGEEDIQTLLRLLDKLYFIVGDYKKGNLQ